MISTLRAERQTYLRMAEKVKPILETMACEEPSPDHQNAMKLLSDMRNALQFYDWLNRFTDFLETGEIFKHLEKTNQTQT